MKTSANPGYIVFLSVVAAQGGFSFGYDTAVISGTIARELQQLGPDTLRQGWCVGCAWVGSVAGVFFLACVERPIGRKLTMLLSAPNIPIAGGRSNITGSFEIETWTEKTETEWTSIN